MARPEGTGRRWRGLSSDERDAQRRRRLLDAGRDLFGTVGYTATPVQGICQHAGVSSRSFYELYDGREALITEVYEQATQDIERDVLAVVPTLAGPARDLDGLVRSTLVAAIGPMLADERLGRVLEIEAVGVSEALETVRRRANGRIADAIGAVLEGLMDAGLVPRFLLGLIGTVLVGGVTEALIAHLQEAPTARRSSDAFVDEMTRIVLRLVAAPA